MEKEKNNIKKSGKLVVINVMLMLSIGGCAFYEFRLRYNVTNTGLRYKVMNVGQVPTEVCQECTFFTIERSIKCGYTIIERPNQYGMRPFIYDRKYHISRLEFDGAYGEALGMLKNKGDKIKVKMKAKDIPDEYGIPPLDVKPWKNVVIELELSDQFSQSVMKDKLTKYRDERQKEVDKKNEIDVKNIEAYIKKKNYTFTKDGEMYIVEIEKGTGEAIRHGDEAKILFYIRIHNGDILQTNIEEIAKKYKIENIGEIKLKIQKDDSDWLVKCLLHLKNKSKVLILVPSGNPYNIDFSKNFIEVYLEVVGVNEKEPVIKSDQKKNNANKEDQNDVKAFQPHEEQKS